MIPLQEAHFESSANKTSPSWNFLLVKVPHFVHCFYSVFSCNFFLRENHCGTPEVLPTPIITTD